MTEYEDKVISYFKQLEKRLLLIEKLLFELKKQVEIINILKSKQDTNQKIERKWNLLESKNK